MEDIQNGQNKKNSNRRMKLAVTIIALATSTTLGHLGSRLAEGAALAGTIAATQPASIDDSMVDSTTVDHSTAPVDATISPATKPSVTVAVDTPTTQTDTAAPGVVITPAPATDVVAAPVPAPAPAPDVVATPAPATAADNEAATDPADRVIATGADAMGGIDLEMNKTRTITTMRNVKTANLLNKDIADIIFLNPKRILITPKHAGTTQLLLTDDQDHTQVLPLTVASDLVRLTKQLKVLFPNDKIEITEAGGSLAVRGHVKSATEADQIMQLATPFAAGGKVINFLDISGGQQVLLHVRFAEVSKTAESDLGVNFGFSDGKSFFGSNVGANPFAGAFSPGDLAVAGSQVAVFGQGAIGKEAFQYFINCLRTNNVLRMLAEPDLVTTSGQQADFKAGGEFPYPVPQAGSGGTTVTIEYKDYGVHLNFLPVVEGDGHIRIVVNPEVSELDYSHSVTVAGTAVPGLTTRTVHTVVDLAEGQTFALAGLLQSDYSANVASMPLLGDIPILGSLFRSSKFQRSETELVILVTPEIVHPLNPADVGKVPGEQWRYPSETQLFVNADMGGDQTDASRAPQIGKGPAPRFHGSYGFKPPVVSEPAPTK